MSAPWKNSLQFIPAEENLRSSSYSEGALWAPLTNWHWVYTNIFINNSIESKITVVAMDVKDGKRRPLYKPEFEVSDSGKRMKFSGTLWVSPKPHEIGDVVDGRYDPSSGKIVSNIMLRNEKYLSSILTNMGAIFFVLGLGYFWWRRKRRNDGWRE